MAQNWTVVNQRQTTVNKPGVGLTPVMQVTFQTDSGHTGSVDIDLATYADIQRVKTLIQTRVDQVNAVAAL